MDMEVIYMTLISASGNAKSCYMEALQQAKVKNFERAEELIKEGEASYLEGHKSHAELVQKECDGENLQMSLLLVHAEDQMMTTELTKNMVKEFIELYKKIG